MSNQKATHQVSKGGIKQAVFVLGGLAVASAIYAISQPAETFPNTARFEVTSVTTPTIVRGATGTQTITIQNRGPDAATGTQALIRPQLTTGVTINSVTGPNGACTFSSPDYVCAVGNVANNATFNVSVVYNVALSASAGTSVKQTEIRINSNQFNPGSGMGETSHKVWGALNQESPTTQNGAFWPGRTSTNPTCNGTGNTCGTFAGENSALLGAWPINTDAPVGQYVNTPQNGDNNDSYFTTTTLQNPTYYRVVDDMANYQYRRLVLPSVSSGTINNRRAWEFRTYVYIPGSVKNQRVLV